MSNFCEKCGAPLEQGVKFCAKCGAPVADNQTKTAVLTKPAGMSVNVKSPLTLGMLIAGAVVILSTFLPYVSVSLFGYTQSQSLLNGGDGVFFIVLAAAAMVLAVLNKPTIAMVCSVITGALSIFELTDANSKLGDYSALVDKGAGCYLNLLGGVALAAISVVWFLSARKNK